MLTTIFIMPSGQGNEVAVVEKIEGDDRVYPLERARTEQKLQAQIDRQKQQRQLLAKIAVQIGHALAEPFPSNIDLGRIFQTTAEGTRQLLDCDRTFVCRLHPDLSGTTIAEAILPEWKVKLDAQINDLCCQDDLAVNLTKYLQGYKMVVSDIESANLTAPHLQMLQQLQVKAILVVPILVRDLSPARELKVWGFSIAHHCEKVYEWQADDLTLLDELSLQIAIAIQQAELVANLQASIINHQKIEGQLRNRTIELEQINLLLSRSTHLLEDRNQELDDFSHIASHDLQAPLRGISNLAEWLVSDLDGKLPIENQQQLHLIQSRVLQMNALINGLLQYARVGRENIDSRPVNLSQLLAEVVELLTIPTEFQIKFPANLPTIETQALLLKQVLSNLIGNAIKYHDRPNGEVEILVADVGSCLQFKVVDDGPGIAPEHHKKIFGIFQTLVNREDLKGTGIGLTIVKKIVESRGGSVWLESDLGRGSTFFFTWPKL